MQITSTSYTTADLCEMLDRGELIVDRSYQRSDKVWPTAARAFLIETMLMGFPIPKLSLRPVTDLKTRRTTRHIVDGQQRCKAIYDFYHGRFALAKRSSVEDAAGLVFDYLPPDMQTAFLEYPFSVDLFQAASEGEIIEIFRRTNSYTVPLNPEEQRHAEYQGPFKWFVYRLTKNYGPVLLDLGVMSQSQLVRMQDAKLFTEVTHALLFGVKTTRKSTLANLYREHNQEFDEEDPLEARFAGAFELLEEFPEIRGGPLMKPHVVYSLLLAAMHLRNAVPALEEQGIEGGGELSEAAPFNLNLLGSALDAEEYPEDLREFVEACEERTNVAAQRMVRVQWLLRALRSPEF